MHMDPDTVGQLRMGFLTQLSLLFRFHEQHHDKARSRDGGKSQGRAAGPRGFYPAGQPPALRQQVPTVLASGCRELQPFMGN